MDESQPRPSRSIGNRPTLSPISCASPCGACATTPAARSSPDNADIIGALPTPRTLDLGRVKIGTTIEHSAIVRAVVETAGHCTVQVLSPACSADLGKEFWQ